MNIHYHISMMTQKSNSKTTTNMINTSGKNMEERKSFSFFKKFFFFCLMFNVYNIQIERGEMVKNKNNGQNAVRKRWKETVCKYDNARNNGMKHINFMAKYNKVSLNYNFFLFILFVLNGEVYSHFMCVFVCLCELSEYMMRWHESERCSMLTNRYHIKNDMNGRQPLENAINVYERIYKRRLGIWQYSSISQMVATTTTTMVE